MDINTLHNLHNELLEHTRTGNCNVVKAWTQKIPLEDCTCINLRVAIDEVEGEIAEYNHTIEEELEKAQTLQEMGN